MINGLTISGFRSFKDFRARSLTRVNLFVGRNNAGKSSLLEAIELLADGSFGGLLQGPKRRGEIVIGRGNAGGPTELDPSHLFYGHSMRPGASLRVQDSSGKTWVTCEAVDLDVKDLPDEEEPILPLDSSIPLQALRFQNQRQTKPTTLGLSPSLGIPLSSVRRLLLAEKTVGAFTEKGPVKFLGTLPLEEFELGQLWDTVVLTPEEDEVAAALRLVEPRIERIAFLGERARSRGIYLKLAGSEERLPLGTVGDGLKRLLYLTLNLFSAREGVLLVDEIDTGLHYTVMADMWKLVIETAKRLDVQVFATTHSQDCVHALGSVWATNPELATEITLHRVEPETAATVAYSAEDMAIAARHHVEVR